MSCEFQSHAGVTEKKNLKFLLLLNRNEDLTIKYYAKKVLVHFRTCRLEKKWHSFLTSPTYKESLLEGALLVSQWGQVEHEQKKSLSEIEDIIDNISKRVRQLVDAKNSTGEAYSVLKTVRLHWIALRQCCMTKWVLQKWIKMIFPTLIMFMLTR
jgi:hypothetical protein